MKITVSVSLGLVGCKKTREVEIEDDMDDDEIETVAQDTVFEMIEWGWEKKE